MPEYELEEVELKIRGHVKGKESIRDARRQLARLHNVDVSQIGHCIDGVNHSEFGANQKFTAMREKDTTREAVHLAKITEDGSTELIPHVYLASLEHKVLTQQGGRPIYVHFYRKR